MHLQKGKIIRKLRFVAPVNLQIEKGFPILTGGIEIWDLRGGSVTGHKSAGQ
jgi:hypothetical protein